MNQSVTELVAKRADQLVVGDRIPDEHLAFRFNQGPAEVVFLALEDVSTLPWVFVAYRYPNGQHDSMTIRPEAVLQVFPADTGLSYSRADDGESPQPAAGREPLHTGAVTDGGLVDETPPIAEHYDASASNLVAECACGDVFGSFGSLATHIALANTSPPPEGFVPASETGEPS